MTEQCGKITKIISASQRREKKYRDKRERDFNEICIAIIIFHARDQGTRTGGSAW